MFQRIVFTIFCILSLFISVLVFTFFLLNEDDGKNIMAFYKEVLLKSVGKKVDLVEEKSTFGPEDTWHHISWAVGGVVSVAVSFLLGWAINKYRRIVDGECGIKAIEECIIQQLTNLKMQVDALENIMNELGKSQDLEELKLNLNSVNFPIEEFSPSGDTSVRKNLEFDEMGKSQPIEELKPNLNSVNFLEEEFSPSGDISVRKNMEFDEMEKRQPIEELKPNLNSVNDLEEEFSPSGNTSVRKNMEDTARSSKTDYCSFDIIGQNLDSGEMENADNKIISQFKSKSPSCNSVNTFCDNNTEILYSNVFSNDTNLCEENNNANLMLNIDQQEQEIKNKLCLAEENYLNKNVHEEEFYPKENVEEKCSSKADKENCDDVLKINVLTTKPTMTVLGAVKYSVGDKFESESMSSCRISQSCRIPHYQKHKASDSKLESFELQEHLDELGKSQNADSPRTITDASRTTRRRKKRNNIHSN